MRATEFQSGNTSSARTRKPGPKIVRLPGRHGKTLPGYYIRWYEPRQNCKLLSATATTPHGLTLAPAPGGGLVVMDAPKKTNPYYGLDAGDIILQVEGVKIVAPEDLDPALAAYAGKLVRVKVNRGGKTGVTPRFSKAGNTRAQAQEALMKFTEIREAKKFNTTERDVLFTRLCDEFIQWAETIGGYSKTWMGDVRRIVECHRKRWGALPIDTITAKDIMEWSEARFKETSASTVNNEISPLRKMFHLAVDEWHYLREDPTLKVKLRRPPKSIPKYLGQVEIDNLIKIAEQHDRKRLQMFASGKGGSTVNQTKQTPDELIKRYNMDGTFDACRLRFLFLTALRKSQFTHLRWKQYDKQRGTITIQTDEVHSEKSRKPMTLPLPQAAVKIIEGQPRICDYIFPNLMGTCDEEIASRLIKGTFAEFEATYGKHVHMHMTRHTALTHLLQHTQNIALVSKYAGHAQLQTTQIYAHVLETQLRAATQDFDITASPTATP